jgi:hypothetical protein
MKPYDKLTILRNRRRARDLRLFREHVETYFERSQDDDVAGIPADWEGAQYARSQINQMLPRVIQIAHAAGLGDSTPTSDRYPRVGDVEVLREIFSPRYANGTGQEILDVVDMALGVYEATHFESFVRTVNPLHYTLTALAFVASLPRRVLVAIGLWPGESRRLRPRPDQMMHLETIASQLTRTTDAIEMRFAELQQLQSRQFAETSNQVTELAERLDFAERVLAQRPMKQIKSPGEKDVVTPA